MTVPKFSLRICGLLFEKLLKFRDIFSRIQLVPVSRLWKFITKITIKFHFSLSILPAFETNVKTNLYYFFKIRLTIHIDKTTSIKRLRFESFLDWKEKKKKGIDVDEVIHGHSELVMISCFITGQLGCWDLRKVHKIQTIWSTNFFF